MSYWNNILQIRYVQNLKIVKSLWEQDNQWV